MKTSVELQEPFSYAVWTMIVMGILLTGYLLYLFVKKRILSEKQKKPFKETLIKPQPAPDIMSIKANYIRNLEKIKSDLWNKNITTRDAYQRMSMCIRGFVYEITGIQVQNYTLGDIRKLNMPVLEELIKEYYAPEFSEESIDDGMAAIEKTERAIEKWN